MKTYEMESVLHAYDKVENEYVKLQDSIENNIYKIKLELEQLKETLKKYCDDLEDEPNPKEQEVYIYFIESPYMKQIKIGISNNPESRLKTLQTAHGKELNFHHVIRCKNRSEALHGERFLHSYYSDFNKRPYNSSSQEWFSDKVKNPNYLYGTKAIGYFDSYQKILNEEFRKAKRNALEMSKLNKQEE